MRPRKQHKHGDAFAISDRGNAAADMFAGMCRAYMAYLHLGWPDKPAQALLGAAAAHAVERLLQQTRSGVALPEPMEL